jgi:hypothetical protein
MRSRPSAHQRGWLEKRLGIPLAARLLLLCRSQASARASGYGSLGCLLAALPVPLRYGAPFEGTDVWREDFAIVWRPQCRCRGTGMVHRGNGVAPA